MVFRHVYMCCVRVLFEYLRIKIPQNLLRVKQDFEFHADHARLRCAQDLVLALVVVRRVIVMLPFRVLSA